MNIESFIIVSIKIIKEKDIFQFYWSFISGFRKKKLTNSETLKLKTDSWMSK